jgi:hypothetical protein
VAPVVGLRRIPAFRGCEGEENRPEVHGAIRHLELGASVGLAAWGVAKKELIFLLFVLVCPDPAANMRLLLATYFFAVVFLVATIQQRIMFRTMISICDSSCLTGCRV